MRFVLVLFYLDFAVQEIEPKSSLLAQTRQESNTKPHLQLSCLLNNAGRFHVEVFAVGFRYFLLLSEALLGHHTPAFLHRAQQAGNATATAHYWERIGPWGCFCRLQPSYLPACLRFLRGDRDPHRATPPYRFLECDQLTVEAGGRATCCPRGVSDANEYMLCNSAWIFSAAPIWGNVLES